MNKNQLIKHLKSGGIAVMPTDTIYGLVGQALNTETVKQIYKIRKRSPDKPLIILISSLNDLKKFGIKLGDFEKEFLNQYWPGAVSVILPCVSTKFKYLHRGTKTLAFRLPKNKAVLEILKKTGPLVAPSANPESLPPANNLTEAKNYFGDKVEYYGKGELKSPASTLVKLEKDKIEILRVGAVVIKD